MRCGRADGPFVETARNMFLRAPRLLPNGIPPRAQFGPDFARIRNLLRISVAAASSDWPDRRYAVELDNFDRKILRCCKRTAACRNATSRGGASLGLGGQPAHRRDGKAGVIRSNQAIVDPAKVGRPITIIVEVSIENERLDLLDAVKRRFVACPAVQQVYYVTGRLISCWCSPSPTWPNSAIDPRAVLRGEQREELPHDGRHEAQQSVAGGGWRSARVGESRARFPLRRRSPAAGADASH